MGYIDENLMQDEKILYRAKLHWALFLGPIIWLILAIIFLASGPESALVGVILLFVAMIHGLSSLIDFTTSEFGLTDKRVVCKTGFIRRRSMEVLLSKVEGIQVNQSILGRILGYGSIIVTGTGGIQNPFKRIIAPLEFRNKVQEQITSE